MPPGSGLTNAQLERVAMGLWPDIWPSANIYSKQILRLGVLEVSDGGQFTYPKFGIKPSDQKRIQDAVAQARSESEETLGLFTEGGATA